MAEKLPDRKFLEYFEKKVRSAIRRYRLFSRSDRIAVAVSGGKDSTACLYVLKKLGYDVEGITIDAAIGNYTKENLENLRKLCQSGSITLRIIEFRKEFGMSLCYIRKMLKSKGHEYSSCMLCGILKRYLLNKYSRVWKFDRLATGHNLDDEAQSFLMNVFRNDFSRAVRQGPVSGIVRSKSFVQRVKPLYLMSEAEIIRYSRIRKFPVNYGICPCSVDAYRRNFIGFLDEFEKKHPSVKYNIVRFSELMRERLAPEEDRKVGLCTKCGEPSNDKTCRTCIILSELGAKQKA